MNDMKLHVLSGGMMAMAMVFVGAGCGDVAVEEVTPEPVVVASALQSGTYTFDTEISTMDWYGEKVVAGNSHAGTVGIKEGTVTVTEGGVISEGTIVIDMNSIDAADEPTLLINHLKNDDFFDTEAFPEATLVVTGSVANENDVYMLTGDLTIKGITQSITFPATIVTNEGMATAESAFEIDRTLWDIKYGSGKFFASLGDNVIKDEMQFTLNITANNLEVVSEETEVEAELETVVEPEAELVN